MKRRMKAVERRNLFYSMGDGIHLYTAAQLVFPKHHRQSTSPI